MKGHGPEDAREVFEINFKPLRTPLQELPIAIVNRLERERVRELRAMHPGLLAFLKLTLRVSAVTWDSIRFLCADRQDDGARRQEFAISVPPLARTLLDSLFTVIFIFDHPTEKARWFYANAWHELDEHHKRLMAKHGANPEWHGWLANSQKLAETLERDAQITPAEKQNPRTIPWWPNPGKMAKSGVRDASRVRFLSFLNDWFYAHLSGDSHLSWQGLGRRGGHLLETDDPKEAGRLLTLYRSHVVFTAVSIFLGLLSEVTGQFKLEYEAQRLRAAWDHLKRWPEAEELFRERYDSWLPQGRGAG